MLRARLAVAALAVVSLACLPGCLTLFSKTEVIRGEEPRRPIRFENTTAALSTNQLDLVLPLWERMAFAHAGLVMLQEQAAALGQDQAVAPAELHDLAFQLSVVLDFAEEIQRMVLDQLTLPVDTSIRAL